jgi:hypothetical protein
MELLLEQRKRRRRTLEIGERGQGCGQPSPCWLVASYDEVSCAKEGNINESVTSLQVQQEYWAFRLENELACPDQACYCILIYVDLSPS